MKEGILDSDVGDLLSRIQGLRRRASSALIAPVFIGQTLHVCLTRNAQRFAFGAGAFHQRVPFCIASDLTP
jgi:hypothetical protein